MNAIQDDRLRSDELEPNIAYTFAGYDTKGNRLFREADTGKGRRRLARRPSFDEVKTTVLKEVRDRARTARD